MKKLALLVSIFTLVACARTRGAVRMPALFGDNMVLQQQTQARLWGRADGKRITVRTSWNDRTYATRTDPEGRWSLRIETPTAGGPYAIELSDGEELVLRNVLIGEIWICSGQSNMAMRLKGYRSQPVEDAAEAILTAGRYRDRIRMFNVPQRAAETPADELPAAAWHVSDPAFAPEFSAVAFFFARYLAESLGVPIGIVHSSWGGSDIVAWMDEAANRRARPDLEIPAPAETPDAKCPVKLFNGMIHPIAGYTARGFIWYQGEANARRDGRHQWYADQLAALVESWRSRWGDDRMPFYIVQIAPYGSDDADGTWIPRLVEQQLRAAGRIPGCAIAATTDLGERRCIHPADKRSVGFRLAVLAMGECYRTIRGVPSTGPTYRSHRFEGDVAVIAFDHASTGLVPVSAPLAGFEMAGEDRIFHPAEAVVDGKNRSSVRVTCRAVPRPVAVRYAFRNWVHADLANNMGLAAFPFRTDDWEDR